jgi:hypothetical protein
LVGVTVGSLRVTCSRLGISLRQPRFKTGTGPLRRNEPHSNGVSRPSPGRGDGSASLQLIKERPEQNSRSGPVEQAEAATPTATPWQEWAKRANEGGFAIKIRYRGEARTTELPLTQGMIGQLAFEAAFRNVTIGELIGQLIVAVADRDLLQTVLEHKKPAAVGACGLPPAARTYRLDSRQSLPVMAGNLSKLPKFDGLRGGSEPVPGDEQATWSRQRLRTMDAAFTKTVERALRTGGESAAAASATVLTRGPS